MASCHSIVATPLLVAFELLLCVYLEGIDGKSKAYCEFVYLLKSIVIHLPCKWFISSFSGHDEPFIDLKLVFLPLLALEIITLVDNFR
jgi:hypothetical protein